MEIVIRPILALLNRCNRFYLCKRWYRSSIDIKISPIPALLKRRNRVISETIEIPYSSGLESTAIGFFFFFLGTCNIYFPSSCNVIKIQYQITNTIIG